MHLLKSSDNIHDHSKHLGQCVKTHFLTHIALILNDYTCFQASIFWTPCTVDDVKDPIEA